MFWNIYRALHSFIPSTFRFNTIQPQFQLSFKDQNARIARLYTWYRRNIHLATIRTTRTKSALSALLDLRLELLYKRKKKKYENRPTADVIVMIVRQDRTLEKKWVRKERRSKNWLIDHIPQAKTFLSYSRLPTWQKQHGITKARNELGTMVKAKWESQGWILMSWNKHMLRMFL